MPIVRPGWLDEPTVQWLESHYSLLPNALMYPHDYQQLEGTLRWKCRNCGRYITNTDSNCPAIQLVESDRQAI